MRDAAATVTATQTPAASDSKHAHAQQHRSYQHHTRAISQPSIPALATAPRDSPRQSSTWSARHKHKPATSTARPPRSFSMNAGTLHNGWKELRDIFDLDAGSCDVVDIEGQSCADGEEDNANVASQDGSAHTSCAVGVTRSQPESINVTRVGLAAMSAVWGAASLWALRQDYDLFSPLLILPFFLPLPLCLTALALLAPRNLTTSSRSTLLLISRLLRAHILLQGIVALTIWETLGETAIYHRPGEAKPRPGTYGAQHTRTHTHTTQVGSLSQRLAFTLVSLAQAGLPLVAGLGAQWALASRLARIARNPTRVETATENGKTETQTESHLLPITTLSRSSSTSQAPAPKFNLTAPASPTHPPSSPLRGRVNSRPMRSTHRSRRPSTAVEEQASTVTATEVESTLRSSPTPLSEGEEEEPTQQPHHRRSQSQPVLPPPASWTSSEMALEMKNLLARGVREGLVPPRRARSDENRL